MQRPLLFTLLLAPLFAGCVAVAAGATAGFLVSREVLPNDVHTAQVESDVEHVWAVVKEALANASLEELEIQQFPRTVHAKVDGASVRVEVLAFDLDRTVVKVQAEKYAMSRGETAERVLNLILSRL